MDLSSESVEKTRFVGSSAERCEVTRDPPKKSPRPWNGGTRACAGVCDARCMSMYSVRLYSVRLYILIVIFGRALNRD